MADSDTSKDKTPADETTDEVEKSEEDSEKESAADVADEAPDESSGEPQVEASAEADEVADEAEADTVEEEDEKPEGEDEEEEEEEERGPSRFEKVAALNAKSLRTDVPHFRPGDTVKVHVRIVEGSKERIQVFEGVVIALKHSGMDRTFTVRKNSWGVGVERTFFINSPKIDKIQVSRKGRVRRAKLYYLRQRAGKAARIKERRMTGK